MLPCHHHAKPQCESTREHAYPRYQRIAGTTGQNLSGPHNGRIDNECGNETERHRYRPENPRVFPEEKSGRRSARRSGSGVGAPREQRTQNETEQANGLENDDGGIDGRHPCKVLLELQGYTAHVPHYQGGNQTVFQNGTACMLARKSPVYKATARPTNAAAICNALKALTLRTDDRTAQR